MRKQSISQVEEGDGGVELDVPVKLPSAKNGFNKDTVSDTLPKRATWTSKIPYVLTLIGYTIGFGDVWRFPSILHSNGGFAFLIPYGVMLFIEGIPLFLLELAIGQRTRQGAVGAYNRITPFLGGIGLTCGVLCYVIGFYYNTLSAWVLAFLFQSFRKELPWKDCMTATKNYPELLSECHMTGQASKFFWYRQLLNISSGIEDPGEWNWYIALCLALVWIIIWVIILNGIKTVQVIVYVTATLPVVTFFCILIASHFLEGSEYAYKILWKPDWSKLYEPTVWLVAATQTFFSLGLAVGSLIVFSSFMPARNNCYKDAVSVSIINTIISLIAALAVFPVLASQGYLRFKACEEAQAKQSTGLNGTVQQKLCDLEYEVRNSGEGTGLLFIAFAEAANNMPWSPTVWSVLFFFALYTIGINSTFGTIEGAVMTIVDMGIVTWPRWILTTLVCGTLMCLSMVFASGWGYYILDYFDTYTANWSLLIVAFLEVVSISYVYGLARFSYDLKLMTGNKPGKLMLICLRVISPGTLIIVLVASIYKEFSSGTDGFLYNRYNVEIADIESSPYPWYVVAIGFILLALCLVFMPLQAILVWRNRSLLRKNEKELIKSCDFPEEELRIERNLENDCQVDNLFDRAEQLIIGKSNLDKLSKHVKRRQSFK